MKILLVGDYPNDPRLGSAKVPHKLAEEFRALGHDCDLLFASDLGLWPQRMHARFLWGPLLAARAIRRAWRSRGPYDVLDIASGEGLAVPLLRTAGVIPRTTAFVSRSNGLEHLNYQRMVDDHHHGLLHKPWYKRWWYPMTRLQQVRQAAGAADRMIAINDRDRQYVVDRRWLPAERIVTVGHGVSTRFLETQLSAGERGHGILFCGTWTGVKGVDYLADAFSQYVAAGGTSRLTILGGGLPAEQIGRSFSEIARTRLRIVERVPEEQVMTEYARHDVLVFPSTYEGFGMVVPEAMSQELPVIATPVGCVSTLIRHGENGWIVPPRDPAALTAAFERLLVDADLRRRLSQNARETVLNLTWTETARRTLDVYADALAERASRHRAPAVEPVA
ncbi:MAG: glycosyltransferase family 4 protein [Planctomycetaceae bacterium]|nr:glycosyltransferase family 4 protein [Planctomycetaceae bacterium]